MRLEGIDARLDQYESHQTHWPRWMQDQVQQADVVLTICTETYRRRFEGRETDGGYGTDWEGLLLVDELYRRHREKVVPIVFEEDDADHVPTVLRQSTRYNVGRAADYEQLYRHLTGQPETPAPPLGSVRPLSPRPGRSGPPSVEPGPKLGPLSPRERRSFGITPPSLDAYRSWAAERHRHLELIGLGADDVRIELDQVFVPVRVSRRLDHFDTLADLDDPVGLTGRRGRIDEELALDAMFRDRDAAEAPHAILFGEPGSGKTTALRKLHRLAHDPAALGLDAGTLPVFFRLRCFTPDLLDLPMSAVLEHELRNVSGERLPTGLGEVLWTRGNLLLLFDGLDEIGDEAHRARVLRRLSWLLADAGDRGIRAVVSTRRSGWTQAVQEVAIDDFRSLDLRPFDDEQIENLVELWFREVSRTGLLGDRPAETKRNTLLDVLTRRERGNQRLAVLVSTPLLLTLLCVVVTRGGEIPRRRVDFYEECLQILVGRWRKQADRDPPVTVERALALAGELAWHLHSEKRRDNLRRMEAVGLLLPRLGSRAQCFAVFDWLVDDAGVLRMDTDRGYGFAHLGLQEHLTARHLASRPDLLEAVCGSFDDSWWVEVLQLVAALPGGRGFAPLAERLLATEAPRRRADLLRTCLEEADAPDLRPFAEAISTSEDAEFQASLLLLLRDHPDQDIEAHAEAFVDNPTPTLAAAAEQYLESVRSPREESTVDVLLVHGTEDDASAEKLGQALRGRAFTIEAHRVEDSAQWGPRLDTSRHFVVAVGAGATDWREVADSLVDDSISSWLVQLPGDPRPVVPEALSTVERFDLMRFDDVDALGSCLRDQGLAASALGNPPQPAPTDQLQSGERFREPLTDMTFLAVPTGRYQRGSNSLAGIYDEAAAWARPEHWVRVSHFWMAHTAVTNRQYSHFLDANPDVEVPRFWRDRRFSGSHQPVVGVTWHDATAYCAWLTETSPLDVVFRLPTEAEWEFAARGEKSLEFPWGFDEPTPELACFGRDYQEEGPEAVGAYPKGAGPFGHLDLAGSVWEWCADAWEEDHDRWTEDEPLDPVGAADPGQRPLRGGGWGDPAGNLRSAIRSRFRPVNRSVVVGFRVVCAPAS